MFERARTGRVNRKALGIRGGDDSASKPARLGPILLKPSILPESASQGSPAIGCQAPKAEADSS